MRALIRNVVLAALILAVNIGAFAYLINQDIAIESSEVIFSAYQPTDITRIDVENSFGGFEIYSEDGGYVVDDIPSEYVDIDRFIEFMTRAGTVSALKCINDNPKDASIYGFDAPSAKVEILYADGVALKLEFGDQDVVSGNYYMRANGGESVYIAAAETVQGFLAKKTAYMDHAVTPALTVTSPLSAIRDVQISGKKLEHPISITAVADADEGVSLAAQSFGAVTHLVMGKNVYELDQTYGIEILGSILDIQALEIVDYNVDLQKHASYGFGDPDMVVDFIMNGGDAYQLLLVEDEEGILAYIDSKNVIYRISRPAFMDVRYEKLMLRWFLSPLLLHIYGVTVEGGGNTYEIDYERASASDQSAKINDQEVDIGLFQSFYRLLTSASADGEYIADAAPEGTPELTITYHYTDERKQDDVMRFYEGSARRMLVEVNGVCEFDIRESFVKRVLEGAANLTAGNAIEENW